MEYNFPYYLSAFLAKHLPGNVGASSNTVSSYRDTFVLFLRYIEIIKIRASKDPLNDRYINEALIGKFLTEWIRLERILEDLAYRFGPSNIPKNRDAMSRLSKCIDISNDIKDAYWNLKKIRNMLVHGVEIPEDREILSYIDRIIEVRKEIESFFN